MRLVWPLNRQRLKRIRQWCPSPIGKLVLRHQWLQEQWKLPDTCRKREINIRMIKFCKQYLSDCKIGLSTSRYNSDQNPSTIFEDYYQSAFYPETFLEFLSNIQTFFSMVLSRILIRKVADQRIILRLWAEFWLITRYLQKKGRINNNFKENLQKKTYVNGQIRWCHLHFWMEFWSESSEILLPSSFFRHILGILVIHWIFWAPAFYGQKNWFFMNSEQNSDQKSSWPQLESSGILIGKADVCIRNLNLKFHMIFWCNNYIRKNILNLQLCCQWKVQDQILPFANLNLLAIFARKPETDGG